MDGMVELAEEERIARRTARRWQPAVCLAMLAAIAASAGLLETLVHCEAVGVWMDIRWARMNETPNRYARHFLDTEDRVVLQDIPGLENSGGGVYFLGASNMKWAMRVPDLPPDQRRLVHNLGGGEGCPWFQRQLVEYLVSHEKILEAGPDKTLIVYGTSFLNAKPPADNEFCVFSNLWRRYGLYEYHLATGIRPVAMHPLVRRYCLEKARCSSFVKACLDRGCRSLVPKSLRRRSTSKDAAAYGRMYEARMGADWQANMLAHRDDLRQFLRYVRQERMQSAVVLLPLASWHRLLPYPARYRELVVELCRTESVPLVDLSDLLGDDQFDDHIHVNDRGLDRLDAALMEIARAHLRRTGVMKSPSPSGRGPG